MNLHEFKKIIERMHLDFQKHDFHFDQNMVIIKFS